MIYLESGILALSISSLALVLGGILNTVFTYQVYLERKEQGSNSHSNSIIDTPSNIIK